MSITRKKLAFISLTALATILIAAGVTYAAFTDKGKVLGSTFSVGSGDIKLLLDVTKGTETENLADEIDGPSFTGILPNWSKDYLLKIYNNATYKITLSSNSNYTTANDPDDLRSIIYVEPFAWNDTNSNGVVDDNETGSSYGKKTITKWKTEGFNLGSVETGQIKALILRFSTDDVSSTKQGKTGIVDFEFDAMQATE